MSAQPVHRTGADHPARPRIVNRVVMVAALLATAATSTRAAEEKPRSADDKPDIVCDSGVPVMIEASVFLIRDPAVQAELQLGEAQAKAVAKVLDDANGPLWSLRDLPLDERCEQWEALLAGVEGKLSSILKPAQTERLKQVVRQARGSWGLMFPAEAKRLSLTDQQKKDIRHVLDLTHQAMASLELMEMRGRKAEDLHRLADRVRAAERRDVGAILTDVQRRTWTHVLGKPFDFSQVRPVGAEAPELRGDGPWINTEPLTLAKLRGRVVVVHFYTFGCHNCVANYPWYKKWQDLYADKEVTIIGIHTPESKGEHNVENVRAKAKENGLAFPILVDNDKQNWQAWANRVWPSVYLIDRRGIIRNWWYGELEYGQAHREPIVRNRIDALLAEKD